MKRLFLLVAAITLTTAAVSLSRSQNPPSAESPTDLQVRVEERNPWTHLRLNNDPTDFQFAILSDRTGGHRARVFSQALEPCSSPSSSCPSATSSRPMDDRQGRAERRGAGIKEISHRELDERNAPCDARA